MGKFLSGQWNAICDICGFEFKSGELRKNWMGLMVCSKDFETRHPQELIRVKADEPSVPWSRPEVDVFLRDWICTVEKSQSIAGVGTAGCLIPGRITQY